ncbi:MAG: hypothetical protein WC058_13905, partial [Phycisphaeraceae bacterium]
MSTIREVADKSGVSNGHHQPADRQQTQRRRRKIICNRSRVIAVFEPKTNVCRKMVEHWLVLPPFLKQNRGFLTP